MNRSLRGLQMLSGCVVGAVVFYLLQEVDTTSAVGIAVLWALAVMASISAIDSVVRKRRASVVKESVEEDEMTTEQIAPQERMERLKETIHGEDSQLPTFWVHLKVAVHELRLTLENEDTTEQRTTRIKEFLTLLNRYDILIDMYANELTEDEIYTVHEDINACAELLKSPDLSR